jgi:16S rRNA (cytosine1402-N4)-methyltransferase
MKNYRGRRSTPKGEHRPVMLDVILDVLHPELGDVVVDCTLGYAGHSIAMLERIGEDGRLLAFDLDGVNIPSGQDKLAEIGNPFSVHHGNFAGFPAILASEGFEGCDCLLADLGMSSMQVDSSERGFSFMRDGPLDMRMDQSRGRTAAELLQTMSAEDLATALRDLGDEPEAEKIASAIVAARETQPLTRTRELMDLIMSAAPVKVNENPLPGEPKPQQQIIRPTARVFQALRILVNRELASLQELLRVLPWCLKPGGRAAIISFHSGEDRLVKGSFKEGLRSGFYSAISEDPLRPNFRERTDNPRARSAKVRWAIRASE